MQDIPPIQGIFVLAEHPLVALGQRLVPYSVLETLPIETASVETRGTERGTCTGYWSLLVCRQCHGLTTLILPVDVILHHQKLYQSNHGHHQNNTHKLSTQLVTVLSVGGCKVYKIKLFFVSLCLCLHVEITRVLV